VIISDFFLFDIANRTILTLNQNEHDRKVELVSLPPTKAACQQKLPHTEKKKEASNKLRLYLMLRIAQQTTDEKQKF
jgi:hypothetical protein